MKDIPTSVVRSLFPFLSTLVMLCVRCKDANQHEPAKATVRAVSFHPGGELLLAGGYDKTLRLFQVHLVNTVWYVEAKHMESFQ